MSDSLENTGLALSEPGELLVLDAANLTIEDDDVSSLRDSHAKSALRQLLSLQTVMSPELRELIDQQETTTMTAPFRSIGKGFCGEIYEKQGTGRIFKRELLEGVKKLWNDFGWHSSVYDEILRANIEHEKIRTQDTHLPLVQVPRLYSYITPQSPSWWTHNPSFSKIAPRELSNLLEAECIPALPYIVRKALVALYCPHDKKEALVDRTNENCLARIYLGVRRQARSKTAGFTLRNFELDLEIVDDLGLEKDYFAREMARALAVMHWRSETDANDVEFILGSAPKEALTLTTREIRTLPRDTDTSSVLNAKKRSSHIWLLDFNNCSGITMDQAGVQKANKAFWDNDPYYPRPRPLGNQDETLWEVFQEAYLEYSRVYASAEVWEMGLPKMFVDAVVSEAERRSETLSAGAAPPTGFGPPALASRTPKYKKKGRQYPNLPPNTEV